MSWLRCKLALKHTLAATAGSLSVRLRKKREGCTVLCYHDIVQAMSVLSYDTVCTVLLERFENQIQFLKDRGFRFVSLSELVGLLGRRVVPARTVLVTFDDGGRSFLQRAMPVLRHHNVPCAVFLATGFISSSPEWLTWSDICALDASGMVEFGAHTVHHPRLSDCKSGDIEREVSESKTTIEKHIGHRVTAFAYPYGGYNRDVVNAVRQAGFVAAFTTKYGVVNDVTHPLLIPRVTIQVDDTLRTFVRKLAGAYDWL